MKSPFQFPKHRHFRYQAWGGNVSEFIFKRRFVFDQGLARGDTVVLPNSAGYLVHFLESRSHQFELAANVFVDADGALVRDGIDGQGHAGLVEST